MATEKQEQLFLVRVQRMCTSPEADLVGGWSAVLAESKLAAFSLDTAAEATKFAFDDCPIKGIRPMTEAEIREWRDDEANG